MRPQERHQHIVEAILELGRVDVDSLSQQLGVSTMTIRRDLAVLEADGAVRRVYRGATRSVSGSYEPPYAVRTQKNAAAKRAIAAEVRRHVEDGQTVILDAGTTGVAVAEALTECSVTVCTPSLRVAQVLAGAPTVRLMLTGGMVRPTEHSLVGPAAVRIFEDHRFDLYVMTVSGVHADHGLSEWNPEDAAVKRAALAAASRCLVVADASKVGSTAFARICAVDAVEAIITDGSVDPAQCARLEEAGTSIVVAGATEEEVRK